MHRASVDGGMAWRQGLALWFLLLSILTHAVVPTGSPLQRSSGSAFSATTAEVAIAPKRKEAGRERAEAAGGDEGRSEGAGAGDPPLLLPAAAPFAPSGDAPRSPSIAGPALPAESGAAAFSARAPPTI